MHLDESIKVPIPEHKIAYKTVSGKKYVYYTVACYRNEQGKPMNDRVSIGKLDEKTGLLIPNRNYYEVYLKQTPPIKGGIHSYGVYLKSIFQDIHNLLIHYLKNETSTNQLIIKKSIKEIIGSNTIAFNFNYTSTIESYTENVIYIHGSLKEDDIILGYDYRDEACFADYDDVYWSKRICRENLAFRRFSKNGQNGIVLSKHKALIECLEIYQTYANSGRGIDDEVGKDVLDFEEAKAIINTIKENDYPNIFYEEIKTIVVLGHGIEADKVYLQGLLQKCPNIEKVIIFRYDKESDEAFNKKARFFEPYCNIIESIEY